MGLPDATFTIALGALRSFRELSLWSVVAGRTRCPPTYVGLRGYCKRRSGWFHSNLFALARAANGRAYVEIRIAPTDAGASSLAPRKHPSAAEDVARNFHAHVPLDPSKDCVALYLACGGETGSDELIAFLRAGSVPLALPVTHETGPLSLEFTQMVHLDTRCGGHARA